MQFWRKKEEPAPQSVPEEVTDSMLLEAWKTTCQKGLYLYSDEFSHLDADTKQGLENRLLDNFVKIAEQWTEL